MSESKCTVSARILHGFKTCRVCFSLQNTTKGAEITGRKITLPCPKITMTRNFHKLRRTGGLLSVSGRTLCGCVSGGADFIGGGQRPGLHRGCRGHRHELCDPVEQHPAGTPTAAAPLCGTGRRKALRLLQRGSLQYRKRTNDRGAVSGQAGTSRFKDLVLK